MAERLIFLISPPRAGSTMLMRILRGTSQIYSRPEPHLLPPLAHLGFWDRVDQAPFDPLRAQQALRLFVADLPGGRGDYLDACRAYTDTLYGRMLAGSGRDVRYFLDKTPANGLVLPFLRGLYPRARYLVLTRHPAAVFASYANSFFDGDYAAAARFNPILSRYIPALGTFLRDPPGPILHLRYEDLVRDPQAELQRISRYLEVPCEPAAIGYQHVPLDEQGLGDPIGVDRYTHPVTSRIDAWTADLAADPQRFGVVARQLASVPAADLRAWGYPPETLWAPLSRVDPQGEATRRRRWDLYRLQRAALAALRRDVHHRPHGAILRRLRFICDVILRG